MVAEFFPRRDRVLLLLSDLSQYIIEEVDAKTEISVSSTSIKVLDTTETPTVSNPSTGDGLLPWGLMAVLLPGATAILVKGRKKRKNIHLALAICRKKVYNHFHNSILTDETGRT